MDHVDCIVAGAGVIGLAVARSLALAGREVVVIEAEDIIGSHTSSRNSEVIHAGIYYAANSLKARFCVAGRKALYAYCRDRHIAHKRTGKLIVATRDEDLPKLASIRAHAIANGVSDLAVLSADEAMVLEPELYCLGALQSPSTGIVDSHGLMLSYQGEAEDNGAMIAFQSRLTAVRPETDRLVLAIEGAEKTEISCSILVNAAGHGAWDIARAVTGMPADAIPEHHLSKGNYYALSGVATPFRQLVYPMPGDGNLGIHFTRDLAGQARFGPDVEWLKGETLDYQVSFDRTREFEDAIRTYWPALPDNAITPTYCGIRPKLITSGAPPADFIIQTPADHGIKGLIQLFGIESPGLTGSLVIGDYIAGRVISSDV
jgi:L-2-hydroxyglutarate oxidase LhgO